MREYLNIIVILGVFCMGGFVGILVGYYVNESKVMSLKVLNGVVWVVAGGAILTLLKFLDAGGLSIALWCYPIGLLGGFLISPLIDIWIDNLYRGRR